MTTNIIYHDFGNTEASRPTTLLTARVLTRGRRWHRFWDNLNRGITAACIVSCSLGIAFSLYVLTVLL